MKLQAFALTSAVAIASVAASLPAMAGESYVTNEYSTRNIYNGYSRTEVKADIVDISKYSEYNSALKAESYGGTRNFASVNFDGKTLTGYAYSDNQNPNDPVAIITYSESSTQGVRVETAKVNALNTYNFSGTDRTHRVSAGSTR